MRRLELTERARADLTSIRRYSLRSWGTERTDRYMMALRDAMKDLVSGRGVGREREDSPAETPDDRQRPSLHLL